MGRKNVVKSYKMIDSGDMSSSLTSEVVNVLNLDKASIHLQWSGSAPDGTVTVEARNGEADSWYTLNMGGDIETSSAEANHQLVFNELPFTDIRLQYAPTGAGSVDVVSIPTGGAATGSMPTAITRYAQTFDPSASGNISSISWEALKIGNPVGNLIFEIYADGGTSPAALLGASDPVDMTTVSSSPITFNFSTPVAVSNGTTYWAVVRYDGVVTVDAGNSFNPNEVVPSAYPLGQLLGSSDGGSSWTPVAGGTYDFSGFTITTSGASSGTLDATITMKMVGG